MAEIISYKRLAKLPRVVLEGTMLRQVRRWFDENHLSPLVPPIFNRFVIEYPASIKCSVPVSDVPRFLAGGFERLNDDELDQYSEMKIPPEYDKLEPHEWLKWTVKTELLIDYEPSLTKAVVTVYDQEKRRYIIDLDYDDLDAKSGIWRAGITAEEPTEEEAREALEENQEHAQEVIRSVIAVQNYILYHRSEQIAAPKVIKVKSKSAETTGKKPKKRKPDKTAVTIKHQKRQVIFIRENDPLPRKEYNYRTLAWNVRGHYARRGADKHLTYIAPYICRRGDEKKKPRAAEYRITEGDKEE